MKMNKIFLAVLGVIVAAGLAFFVLRDVPAPATNVEGVPSAPYAKVPQLALTDYEGKTVDLSEFSGTPLVVNSWAAWCPFCKKELTDFAAVQKEFGDKIRIIAVDRGESKEVAKRYSDELGVSGDLIFLLDPGDSFYQAIGGFSMPETIFVDREGNIRLHKRGPMNADEIRRRINEILVQVS